TEPSEVSLGSSPKDGVFPDDFYSTTNLETEVHLGGRWIPVENITMDSAILVKGEVAVALKMKDALKGQSFVIGSKGVRVLTPERVSSGQAFKFMTSGVSSEKPLASLITEIAAEMEVLKKDNDAKILFVCGPAIVHTGSREFLSSLIDRGYVDTLFAGNALATHDIEASIYGTSLGVSLSRGVNVTQGHNHHLRTINTIRGIGSIKTAVEEGIIKDGIMYSVVKKGIDFLLAGSIRDDGPLPEVITDSLLAQTLMAEKLKGVKMAIMISTMLHSIATGNLLPASVSTICVDIDPSTITKLADRGTQQARGLVLDAGTFLRELSMRLP
ncbi:MAG: TIGR00300 family protein, partial [Deltaproteobacteria bacterium]|nr:TIGR00300 family protein [Deltaproteobacteria bacterium]